MKKKEYKEPFIRVVELKSCDIICTSGTQTLGRGIIGEDEEPDICTDGYIWAE